MKKNIVSHDYEYMVGLGSSIGNRMGYLNQAVTMIQSRIGPVTSKSAIYETTPLGPAKSMFLNAALICLTNYPPKSVMAELLAIESILGRTRAIHWGDRTIDLDILLGRVHHSTPTSSTLKNIELEEKDLTIPHPAMANRNFVLVPAAEIAPDWTHPRFGKTIANLKASLGTVNQAGMAKFDDWQELLKFEQAALGSFDSDIREKPSQQSPFFGFI